MSILFLLEENVSNFFGPKCQYIEQKMLINYYYWTKDVSNFLFDLNIIIFLLD